MLLKRQLILNLLFSLILFLATSEFCFSQIDQKVFEKSFDIENLKHPYLVFDENGKKEILNGIKNNKEQKEDYERQMLVAYKSLKMPVNDKIPNAGDVSRYYSNNELRYFMDEHYTAALNLAFAYQLTGKKEFADKAFLHAEMLCRLETWVFPFHEFPQIYDRVWPYNVGDDQVVFSFDIQAARVARNMALVYDWIYDAIDKGQRDRIRGALLEKAITRVRGNFEFHWWASAYRCNWSGICYSGAGIASLAILTENPQLIDVVTTSYNGVSDMLDELGPDGGWQEGRGYWAYGISSCMSFMDAVKRLSSDEINLFTHPILKEKPADYPLFAITSNFGDGHAEAVGMSWFLNKLISETGNQYAAYYNNEFMESKGTVYDLIWPKPNIAAVEPAVKSKYFKGIDNAFLRSSFKNDESFTLSCKAGLNDDPHHGHLDCGHFSLHSMGEPIILDPGRAFYDDFYFSAERWGYVEASSQGHNLIYVNGEQQFPAKLKDQPWKENIGGKINDFYTSNTTDFVSMIDLEKAYPGMEMKSWQRIIVLEKPSLLVVLDRVGSEKGAEISSRLHPDGELDIHANYYGVKSEKSNTMIIPFSTQKFNIEPGRQGSLTVNDNADFKWIQYVDVNAKSKSESTLMGYLIFSNNQTVDAEKVAASIQIKNGANELLELSFTLDGKSYVYPFSKLDNKIKLELKK